MARPVAAKPTCTPFLRGTNLSVRWSFRRLSYRTPVLAKGVDAVFVAANGYVKNTHPDFATINTEIAAAIDRLEQATTIMLVADDVTEKRIAEEYARLTNESVEAAQAVAKAEYLRTTYKSIYEKFSKVVTLPELEEEIVQLQELLQSKLLERDYLKKELNIFYEDTLVKYLSDYTMRKGKSTMEASTARTFNGFIKTVQHFDENTKIQDVDDDWLTRFQDWLISTPSKRAIYSYKMVDGRQQKQNIIRYDTGETRKNSTVINYISKITSCLKYYQARPELLPVGIHISDKYKRFELDLAANDDNVIALEEQELFELFRFKDYRRKTHERAIDLLMFMCSTSLRFSDVAKVTPTTIKNGEIQLTAKKTKKRAIEVTIPLNPISSAILKKYNYTMSNALMKDYLLNERIREVLNYDDGACFPSFQVLEKITRYSGREDVGKEDTRANLIGAHSGRRTFINICLDYNVPINKIIGMTGHTNVNTLMIYANKRKGVKKHMNNVFQLPAYDRQNYDSPPLLANGI